MKSIFENYPIVNATYEDAVKYIRVLQYIAGIDGIHKVETTAIKSLISAHNWSSSCYNDALKEPINSIGELQFSKDTIKVFAPYLLRDMIAIAHTEGGFSATERKIIKDIANELEISAAQLDNIHLAVSQQFAAIHSWSKAIHR